MNFVRKAKVILEKQKKVDNLYLKPELSLVTKKSTKKVSHGAFKDKDLNITNN